MKLRQRLVFDIQTCGWRGPWIFRRAYANLIVQAIAWRLPRKLAYWATIRVGAHATTGQWGSQIVPDLRLVDALERWEQ